MNPGAHERRSFASVTALAIPLLATATRAVY